MFAPFVFGILVLVGVNGLTYNSGGYGGLRYPYSTRLISGSRYPFGYPGGYPNNYPGPQGCPVCDSSVYSYCSHRLVHDSCCCGDSYYTENSFECQYTDCSFIHANTCQESNLIASCCCEDDYRSFNPLRTRLFIKK